MQGSNNTDSEYAAKLFPIFQNKEWEISDLLDEKRKSVTFDLAIKFLSALDKETAEMFLALLSDYIWLSTSAQLMTLARINNRIQSNPIFYNKTIYIAPFIKKDVSKISFFSRSGILTLNLFRELNYKAAIFPHAKHIYFCDCIESIPVKAYSEKIIFYVDDFIGTGDTACEALKNLHELRPKLLPLNGLVHICSLAATPSGIKTVQDKFNIDIIYEHTIDKGISNNINLSQSKRDKYLELMEQFEQKLKVDDNHKFGYGRLECLLTTSKTPNNTFPGFWLDTKDSQYDYQPIFERK